MSELLVLDCTITASWFIPDETTEQSQKILNGILNQDVSMTVPSLWWFEILNVMKNAIRRKRITEPAVKKALFLLKEIPMKVVEPEKQGQSGILSLTLLENLSAYDAAYLHLALSSGADLYSTDSDFLILKKKYPCIKSPAEYRHASGRKT